MPHGTRVEKLYKKLISEGQSKESAARIAQSQTGQSLATGRTLDRIKKKAMSRRS